jgi:hypothetical protein
MHLDWSCGILVVYHLIFLLKFLSLLEILFISGQHDTSMYMWANYGRILQPVSSPKGVIHKKL